MTIVLPERFTSRPATLDDVDAAVALVNACSVELIGRPEWEAHEFRTDWQSPAMNPETDLHVVLDRDDQMVGYAGLWDIVPHVKLFGWVNVHPQWRGQGVGTYLGGWLEARARRSIAKAPPGTRVVLAQDKLTIDEPGRAYLLAHGYQVARYFARMLIEMGQPPPCAVFPEGIAVRAFPAGPEAREQWLRAVILAEKDIFRDHWGYVERSVEQEFPDWLHWIENDPDFSPSLWFLAMAGDEIAAVSLCSPKTAEDPEMGYVRSLGVRRAYRRQGVGLGMLHHTFGAFYRRGTFKVALDVDAESLTGATRLYERAGMHVQRQSASYEKELRPGRDLSTQAL